MNSKWLFSGGFAFELASLAGLMLGTTAAQQLGYFISLHLMGSALIALGVWILLPKRYRRPLLWSYAFFYSITAFIPFIGAIGLVSCILPSLYIPKRKKTSVLHDYQDIELPYTPLEMEQSPLFNEGGLQDVLHLETNESKRLNALLATRNMNKQDAIPILKKALRDPTDDIRLLAYAMLDKYESHINAQIEHDLSDLKAAKGAHKAELHKRIAHNYWELAYLGLAQGSVLEHALSQAQENIRRSMTFKETAELALLAGKVGLKQQRSAFSASAFRQAIALGMDKQKVLPYLAESAYLAGEYQEIPKLLQQLPEAMRNSSPFTDLMDYWHANANHI